MKYFGFRNSKADIFPGSRVKVAENNNFWQEAALGSKKNDEKCGCGRRWRNDGASPSGSGVSKNCDASGYSLLSTSL